MRSHAPSVAAGSRTLSQAKEVKELSLFRFKKFLFLASNLSCGVATFVIFVLSLYDIYRIKNAEAFPLAFPITLVAIYGSTAVINMIGWLAVHERSVRLMRFFYFLLWLAFTAQVVALLCFLVPSRVWHNDYLVRRFRERVADIMVGAIGVVVLQIFTLITGVEFTLVVMNEFHEADMSTIKSMCSISEYTLDGCH